MSNPERFTPGDFISISAATGAVGILVQAAVGVGMDNLLTRVDFASELAAGQHDEAIDALHFMSRIGEATTLVGATLTFAGLAYVGLRSHFKRRFQAEQDQIK